MPVTGSNLSIFKSLSILIYTGGLSFYDRTSERITSVRHNKSETASSAEIINIIEQTIQPDNAPSSDVKVIYATPRFAMIPTELFDSREAEVYLKSKSITPDPGETIIITTLEDITLVMTIDKTVASYLRGRFSRVVITHPLAVHIMAHKRLMRTNNSAMMLLGDLGDIMPVTLHSSKDELLFAEYLPFKGRNDVHFFTEHIKRLSKESISIACLGDRSEWLCDILKDIYPGGVDILPLSLYYDF